MNCSKCGAKIETDALFCTFCGAKIEQPKKFCHNCGAVIKEGSVFCEYCGNKIVHDKTYEEYRMKPCPKQDDKTEQGNSTEQEQIGTVNNDAVKNATVKPPVVVNLSETESENRQKGLQPKRKNTGICLVLLILFVVAYGVLYFKHCTSEPETKAGCSVTQSTSADTDRRNATGTTEAISHTNDELCAMAMSYYNRKNNVSEDPDPSIKVYTVDSENSEYVSITICNQIDDGNGSGHESRLESYTVNRKTCKGTDEFGEDIDISQ